MTPAQAHINLEESFSAGMLAINTVGEPGAQGAGMTGIHGCGVRTPSAAAVAAATAGLARELHMPNGGIFTIGLLSMILASGVCVSTQLAGNTINELGAAPKLHCMLAPIQTCIPIATLCEIRTRDLGTRQSQGANIHQNFSASRVLMTAVTI